MADKPQEIGSNSDLDIEFTEVEDFLSDMNDKQKAVSEATGSLRSHLKSILGNTGWHKRAAGMIREIDGMSETSRADFLRTFEPMMEVMVVKKWRDEASDIFDDQTTTIPPKSKGK